MATKARNHRIEPTYKQHAIVDDVCGVILDIAVTTGEINQGQVVIDRSHAADVTIGTPIRTVTTP